MKIVENKITIVELSSMAERMFEGIVKAVVDIEKGILVIDADMHSDQEEFLLENGSDQDYLWGINLQPDLFGTENFVEFDSMINLRSSQGNRTRGVEDIKIQTKIRKIVDSKVIK